MSNYPHLFPHSLLFYQFFQNRRIFNRIVRILKIVNKNHRGGNHLRGKSILASAFAAALTFSAFAPATSAHQISTASTNTNGTSYDSHNHSAAYTGGPLDLSIANEERLIKMLKKEGTIKKNATDKEAQTQLKKYLKKKEDSIKKDSSKKFDKEIKALQKKWNKKKKGKRPGKGHDPQNGVVQPVKEEKYKGPVVKDKVLVLMMEFPDYNSSNIRPEDTDMYYKDYPKKHYQDMVFGKKGYKGPNGENLISMKQYYEQQSGGSYTVDGEVAGWYMAKKPAAEYGGNYPTPDGSDKDPRSLVKEALEAAANDPNIDLSEYDQEDRYDLDGDGNTREPDGMIDHLMIIHSAVGEEAGGGSLGGDAIWSHRWNLGSVFPITNTETDVPYWKGQMAAYDYTVQPIDGAAGVFSHEYGHDLGLPDEYDTQYSGSGEAVAYWSIMASGSWAGKVPGAEPTGFSPYAKEFLQESLGGNWLNYEEVDLDDLNRRGSEFLLDQANTKGKNLDALKVNLPDKKTTVNTPYSGKYEYYSGKGNNLNNSMVTSLDLTNKSTAQLSFKTWYQIEQDWDYASVQVREKGQTNWTGLEGNLTTSANPNGQNPGNGITGKSNGWVDGTFDLKAYAGKQIELRFNYWTDVAAIETGFFVDDITITADGQELVKDNADTSTSAFTLEGFTKNEGYYTSKHYYLAEWRNHQGVDLGLAHIKRGASLMKYDGGLVVWYVDNSYSDNWTGIHPGEGFLGVVDADQGTLKWSDKSLAATRFQIHDAAFRLDNTEKMFVDYKSINGLTLSDFDTKPYPVFDDSKDYSNPGKPDAGRNIPEYGIKIKLTGQSKDRTVGKIVISK